MNKKNPLFLEQYYYFEYEFKKLLESRENFVKGQKEEEEDLAFSDVSEEEEVEDFVIKD